MNARSPRSRASPSRRSPSSLPAPYGLDGCSGSPSSIGTRPGSPYTAAVEENTRRPAPAACAAAITVAVPFTLTSWYQAGSRTDSPTSASAAMCTTASQRCARSASVEAHAVAHVALLERRVRGHRVAVAAEQVVVHGDARGRAGSSLRAMTLPM